MVVAASLHALGERFSLFHLASFLLVIGLGLDYALFFNRRDGYPGGERTHRLWPGRMQHDHDLGIRSAGPFADPRAPSHRIDHGLGIAGLSGLCRVPS